MNIYGVQGRTKTKLSQITWLSQTNPKREFTHLLRLFNEEGFVECFKQLDGNRAVGTDKVSKAKYGLKLLQNLENLVARMKRMAYRPQAVRQVLIPKMGKPGATRPLGISNFEDKLVQKMMQKVLESIYEPLFLECSYGFRPGKGCHDAIRALVSHLNKSPVEAVIDVDISNFFGSICHKELEAILRMKIKDKEFMRYVIRMFKAGILADGELTISEEGVMQGSCCSPVLANIYAHYVIDEWFEGTVKAHCKGSVKLVRYCDDLVVCCEHETDAIRIKRALTKRLAMFKLKLNEDKTQIVNFSRSTKRASFNFLGFTFYRGAESILDRHIKETSKRIAYHDAVLAIQDTSYLTYTSHKKTTGLGVLYKHTFKNAKKPMETKGLVMHTTLVVSTDGLPLGILNQKIHARPEVPDEIKTRKEKSRKDKIAIEDKVW